MDIDGFLRLVDSELEAPFVRARYLERLRAGDRVGQAFVNALRNTEYYDRLTGTIYDPFYHDGMKKTYEAIDFLTSK